MKITDSIQEFILYKQSLGMSYKNRALKLNAFAHCAGPVEIDSVAPETVRRFLNGDRPVTTEWFNKFSALKMFFRFALSRGYATHNPLPISQPKSPRAVPALHLLRGRSAEDDPGRGQSASRELAP